MAYRRDVKCFDCGMMVAELRDHRAVCGSSRKAKSRVAGCRAAPNTSGPSGTVECYGCHAWVADLRTHKVAGCGTAPAAAAPAAVPSSAGVTSSTLVAETCDFYILLDVSSSMAGSRLDAAKAAVDPLIAIMNRDDRLAIITFDTAPYWKLHPRAVGQIVNQSEMATLLPRIRAGGCTALFDAIVMAVEQIRDKSRRTIVTVITDGEDNSSRNKLEDVQRIVAEYPMVTLHIVHVDSVGARIAAYEALAGVNYKVVGEIAADTLAITY